MRNAGLDAAVLEARRQAFDLAFDQIRPDLMRYVLSKVGSQETAADIVQDVAAKCWDAYGVANAQEWNHPYRRRSLIYKVASNAVVDERRRTGQPDPRIGEFMALSTSGVGRLRVAHKNTLAVRGGDTAALGEVVDLVSADPNVDDAQPALRVQHTDRAEYVTPLRPQTNESLIQGKAALAELLRNTVTPEVYDAVRAHLDALVPVIGNDAFMAACEDAHLALPFALACVSALLNVHAANGYYAAGGIGPDGSITSLGSSLGHRGNIAPKGAVALLMPWVDARHSRDIAQRVGTDRLLSIKRLDQAILVAFPGRVGHKNGMQRLALWQPSETRVSLRAGKSEPERRRVTLNDGVELTDGVRPSLSEPASIPLTFGPEELTEDERAALFDAPGSPHEVAIRKEYARPRWECIDRLKPAQRAALWLKEYHGLSEQQIAGVLTEQGPARGLNLPIPVTRDHVRSILEQAKAALGDCLDSRGANDA